MPQSAAGSFFFVENAAFPMVLTLYTVSLIAIRLVWSGPSVDSAFRLLKNIVGNGQVVLFAEV